MAGNPLSAAFWADAKPGDPLSYEALVSRRKIAEELAKRSPFPKTIGEGLTYGSERLLDALDLRDLDQRSREFDANQDKLMNTPVGGGPNSHIPGAATVTPPGAQAQAETPPADTAASAIVQGPPAPAPTGATPPRPTPQVRAYNDPATRDISLANLSSTPFSDPLGGRRAGEPSYSTYGNAPARFQPDINTANGPVLLPEQPQPGRFTRAFGPTPDINQAPTDAAAATPLVRTAALPATTATDATAGGGATPNVTGPALPQTPSLGKAPDILPSVNQAQTTGPAVAQVAPLEKAPATMPSLEAIPPATPQVMKPPGAAPVNPGPVPMSADQRRYLTLQSSPHLSPLNRERMKELYKAEETFRSAKQQEQQNQYQADRATHHQDTREYEKFVRETVDRNIKQHGERLGLEKTQVDIAKGYVDLGVAQETAMDLARTQVLQAKQTLAKGAKESVAVGGTHMERDVGDPNAVYKVPAGLPPVEKKPLTVEQAKAVTFVRDVLPDMDLLETKLDHGSALATSLTSSVGASIPGLGNVLPSQKYLDSQNALGRFKGAVMQHLSGAAVSPSEAERNLPAFIPRYGDSREEVLRKAERRRNYVNAVEATAGDPGKDAIEAGRKLVMQANGELPPVRVNTPEEAKNLGAGQVIILPNGDHRTVPWPKHLLPK